MQELILPQKYDNISQYILWLLYNIQINFEISSNFNMIYGYPLLSECCSIIHSSDQYFYFSLADVENRAQPIRLNLLKPAGIDGDSGDLSPLSWGFVPTNMGIFPTIMVNCSQLGEFSLLMGISPHIFEFFATYGEFSPLSKNFPHLLRADSMKIH